MATVRRDCELLGELDALGAEQAMVGLSFQMSALEQGLVALDSEKALVVVF